MRTITRWIAGVFFIFMLAGCATMSDDDCRYADWYLLGLEDGRDGRPAEYFQNRQRACFENNIDVDADRWADGHAEGLSQFCTPMRGWREGRDGRSYRYACPSESERQFLPAFEAGERHYNVTSRLAELEAEVASLEAIIIEEATTQQERRDLLARSNAARENMEVLRAELIELEAEARRRGWIGF